MLEHLYERCVLVQALHEQLRVGMQAPFGFLRFDRRVARVDPSVYASLCGAAAPENILSRRAVTAAIAIGTQRENAHAEEVLVCETYEHSEAVYSSQWISGQ